MKWLRFILFIFLFTIEIRIKAQAEILDQPESCYQAEGQNCIVKSLGETGDVWTTSEGEIRMAPQSIVSRQENQWRLISGRVWIDCSGQQIWRGQFAKWTCLPGQAMMIEHSAEGLEFIGLKGSVALESHSGEKLALSPGLSVKIGPVLQTAKNEISFPRSANLRKTLSWAAELMPLDEAQLKSVLSEFLLGWHQSREHISRTLASHSEDQIRRQKDADLQRELARQKNQKEDAELRALFRKKNYLD